jgi:hypothetical protein
MDGIDLAGLMWFSTAGPSRPAGGEPPHPNALVRDLLAAYGNADADVTFLGAGENFLCYGAGSLALLLGRTSGPGALERLRTARVCSDAARRQGVRTPAYLAVESRPVPHAICERIEGRAVGQDPRERVELYAALGDHLRRLHRASVSGAGPIRPDNDQVRGCSDTWRDHCETFALALLSDDPVEPAARLRHFGSLTRRHWRLFLELVVEHGRRPTVLCHYDNRGPNLSLTAEGLTLLDWDLARVAPLSHELIKPEVDRDALLDGYGVPPENRASFIDDADVAVMMDGLAMSLEWLDEPRFHGGVRRWLAAIQAMLDHFMVRAV